MISLVAWPRALEQLPQWECKQNVAAVRLPNSRKFDDLERRGGARQQGAVGDQARVVWSNIGAMLDEADMVRRERMSIAEVRSLLAEMREDNGE